MHTRLTLQQLFALSSLARLGSFRDAAIEMGISQPGLSRTIQAIEARMGARIFDRDTHRVALTPAGEFLLPQVERLLREYEQVFRDFDDFVAGDTGLVRISALPSVSAVLLASTLARCSAERPTLRFELMEHVGDPVHRAVKDGAADIAIGPQPADEDLNYRELLQEEIVLICTAGDPLAEKAEHDWSVFSSRPFLTLSPDTALRAMAEEALKRSGTSATPVFVCKHPSTLAAFVEEGMGIAALPRLAAEQVSGPALVFRRLTGPAVSRSIGFVTHSRRSLSPAAKFLIQEVRAAARKLAGQEGGGIRAR